MSYDVFYENRTPLTSAGPDGVPSSWTYKAAWVTESYPHDPLAPGTTDAVTFTFREPGTATLYYTGANKPDCRASTPIFLFTNTAASAIYTLSLHDALPIYQAKVAPGDTFTCTIAIKAPQQAGD